MRVYISVDMEGISGVVHEDQTDPIEARHAGEYNRFRRLMTDEANAAITGALDAGATSVLVNDSHWLMRNLLAEELHPAAQLLSGGPKLLSMVEGIDTGFDAAMFIGYHARAGTARAIIDHTYTSRVYEVRINGQPVGELALNAAIAGLHGVPVALVSGDQAIASEARSLLGESGGDGGGQGVGWPVRGPEPGPQRGVPAHQDWGCRGAPEETRPVHLRFSDWGRGGLCGESYGRHGRAGTGVPPGRRADRALQRFRLPGGLSRLASDVQPGKR